MAEPLVGNGRILLADDEQTFRESTADLLRRAGYECDTAPDAPAAVACLGAASYDLLIADIRMPGNLSLDLLRHTADRHRGLPVILVTGYPSLDTAIRAIELPVVAYLVKPVDFDHLLLRVRAAIGGTRITQALRDMQTRLHSWRDDLARATDTSESWRSRVSPAPFETFLAMTTRTIADCVDDLRHLAGALAGASGAPEPCHLLNCPRLRRFQEAVVETIDVLEQTKGAFKSRQLGDLRRRLEEVVREAPPQSACGNPS